jgi:hypothetical protein
VLVPTKKSSQAQRFWGFKIELLAFSHDCGMMPDLCGPMESVSPIANFIITVVLAVFELDLVIPKFKQCMA